MGLHRRAAQRDANEPEIIAEFEAIGYLVQRHTAYDLDVCCRRCSRILAVEVKALKGRLTESQKALIDSKWPLNIVRSTEDVHNLARLHSALYHSGADA